MTILIARLAFTNFIPTSFAPINLFRIFQILDLVFLEKRIQWLGDYFLSCHQKHISLFLVYCNFHLGSRLWKRDGYHFRYSCNNKYEENVYSFKNTKDSLGKSRSDGKRGRNEPVDIIAGRTVENDFSNLEK